MRFLPLLLALATGCASYEYDLTRPPELARHIGKEEQIFKNGPVEYRLQTVDSRLVMLIYNTTDTPLSLLGDRSSVVDQKGQSHPLQNQPIAPHSYARLILPPPLPRIERGGPTFGIGVGTSLGSARPRGYTGVGIDDDFYDQPRYLAVDNDALYWDWTGESEIRLTLVFDQGGKTFEQEYVLARRKK